MSLLHSNYNLKQAVSLKAQKYFQAAGKAENLIWKNQMVIRVWFVSEKEKQY